MFTRNKKGPSLMTTVAMPVFSTKNETKNQGILLGVVGTDIPLQELMKIIPKHLLGIHGYAFAITNNGYILTHPDLKPLIQAIKLYLTGRKPHIKYKGRGSVFPGLNHSLSAVGDRELIQEVLFDAVVTAPLEAYWTGLALNKSENSDKGVEIAYLGTRTGLSRTSLFVVPEHLSNQDFLTVEDKEGVFNADHFPLWYKRAAELVPGTFVYSNPFGGSTNNDQSIGLSSGNENKSVVLASTAIQLLDDRKSPIVASVGIQMKLDFFQRKFWTASRQCAALDGKCTISCDNEDIKCYLIDNNGFILVTEDYSQTGLFFGEVESAVMNKLLLMGSFKRITLYDYQALCREYAGSSDSARSLSHPFSIVKWLLTKLVIFLLEFNLYSWWHVDLSVKAQRSRGKTMMVPCDTEYPAFVSERTIKETTGNIDCEGCARYL
ncbi:voltage-dependent calcium channel subunit alpha-2/delta-3 [Salmo salar]|uniref:Voltage-dependent calcium channel subunit alpha-2/delta-3 n=1 Tax=Salmo salar TaxID=8030 RepID=A0ABM3EA85_SALSA|nr:voltage-dependent calcium channel subunit alpha-2/delta-3-like [Salmo salar]